MKINRKRVLVIVGVIAALFGVSVAAGIVVRNVNAQMITVVPVESLAQDMDDMFFDSDEDSLTGQVTSRATQEVRLTENAVVSEVYVKKGDRVRAGDRLMAYDTTLKEMELEIERLVRQQNEQKLDKAKKRLDSLQNGGPVEEQDGETESLPDRDEDSDEAALPMSGDAMPASVSAFQPVAVRTAEEPGPQESPDPSNPTGTPEPETSEETGTPQPTDPQESPDPSEPGETPDPTEPPKPGPYKHLDYDSKPFDGKGTKDSPFLFWGDVNAKGFTKELKEKFLDDFREDSFLYKMAGYNKTGKKRLSKVPYYYRIVFYKDNDMEKTLLCTTSKDLVGELPPKKEEPAETPIVVGGDDSDYGDSDSDSVDSDSDSDFEEPAGQGKPLSRENAIASQKKNIESLEIELRENDLSISKLEKEVANQTVTAAMDGVVSKVGEPGTVGDGDEVFLKVKSDEGLYIRGGISEMQLDRIEIGQMIDVTAYESGTNCQAEIRDISLFPEERGSEFYMVGNPNVSYYAFTAVVNEKADLINDESVAIRLAADDESDGALTIEAAFVREEDGVTFVYKDDNGKLKRQPVDAMKNPDGYTVAIHSGLSLEDKIAFPYGKGVKNGARTKEGTLDDVYGYY